MRHDDMMKQPILGVQKERQMPPMPMMQTATKTLTLCKHLTFFLCLPGTTNARRERIVIQSQGTV